MKNNQDIRGLLCQCWSRFREVATEENRAEIVERYKPEMKRFELGLFRIVVMGEIKKGKSSFVNSLLGDPELLPVTSDIATSVVFKVLYGPERKFKVFFQQDMDTGKRREPFEITREQLADYGTENGNPRNDKRVDFIGVEEPNPLLKEGIVLIDTPGVGGLHKAHREISWRYAPNADAVFFVLDSVESVMSRDEVTFLQELKDRLKKQVFFVQTKIDAVDSEQSESWRERNMQILEQEVGLKKEHIRYFPVSSELKKAADQTHDGPLLEESGFLTLLDFIHNGLKAKKDEILAVRFATSLALSLGEMGNSLQKQLKLLQTESNEELAEIRKKLDVTKQEFIRWEQETFQGELRNFQRDFDDLKRKYRRCVQEELDPNGPVVSDAIKSFRANETLDVKALAENSEYIQQEWLAAVAERFSMIQEAMNTEVLDLVKKTSVCMKVEAETLERALSPLEKPSENLTISTEQIHMNLSGFDTMRTGMYGGMAGGMMATVAISLASMVFPPAGVLYAIAPWIGGVLGGHFALDSMTKSKQEEVLNKLKQQLQVMASQVLRGSLNHIDEMGTTYERNILELFQTSASTMKKNLEEQVEQAGQAMMQSKEEKTRLIEGVKHRMGKVDSLMKVLTEIVQNPSSPGSVGQAG